MLQTTNYNFPICEAADKGGWLSTFNNAMNGIDASLKTVADSIPEDVGGMTPEQIAQLNDATQKATAALNTANTANNAATQASNKADNAQDTADTAYENLFASSAVFQNPIINSASGGTTSNVPFELTKDMIVTLSFKPNGAGYVSVEFANLVNYPIYTQCFGAALQQYNQIQLYLKAGSYNFKSENASFAIYPIKAFE